MTPAEFKQYLTDEVNEMQRYKWIESEKVGYDLGQNAIFDWISKYASQYRINYTSKNKTIV